MTNNVVWLRISYWVGAIADFVLAFLVLIPERMGVSAYCYPMGLMSAVAFSWGCMLIWADRKPLERKWILLPTILVVTMLLVAGIYSLSVGVIPLKRYYPNFIIMPTFVILWSVSYYKNRDIIKKYKINFFEFLTVLAMSFFEKQGVDYIILEAGLGGRLDSTNIFNSKYSIITNVSFDHKNILGNTIQEIAYEKLGIIKKNSIVFTGIRQK